MKENSFLYGEDAEVPEIPADVIMRRVELLTEHEDKLLSVDPMQRETYRLNCISNAKKFWSKINYGEIE